MEIEKGQKWSIKNSNRSPVVIDSYDKYSEKVYWHNEDSPSMVFDSDYSYFIDAFSLVENI